MKDRIYEHDNNLKEIGYRILEATQDCDIKEINNIFENVKSLLHLATTETHDCQM